MLASSNTYFFPSRTEVGWEIDHISHLPNIAGRIAWILSGGPTFLPFLVEMAALKSLESGRKVNNTNYYLN